MKADEPERPDHLSWRPGGGGEEANRTRGNKGTATLSWSSQLTSSTTSTRKKSGKNLEFFPAKNEPISLSSVLVCARYGEK
jgi:hypothetical protein